MIIAIGEWFLYHYSLSVENVYALIGLAFVQTWWLILVGFLFFQTFKYVRLPKKMYTRKKYETDLFFQLFGLDLFRKALINSFFRHLNPRVYLKGRGDEYFRVFHKETEQSETSHLFSLIATLIPQIAFLMEGEYVLFLSLTVWSIIFNIYPMLLQRRNRFRMEKRYPNLFGKYNAESGS